MPISEYLQTFVGFTVRDFDPGIGLTDLPATAYRIRRDPEGSSRQPAGGGLLSKFFGRKEPAPSELKDPLEVMLEDPKAGQLQGLVYGYWMQDFDSSVSSAEVVAQLAGAAARLPQLRALFLGDMTYEECEISWITQSDVRPLLAAWPGLEHFGVRGSNELTIGPIKHPQLRSLVIECGGLPVQVLREVLESELPALEHLELYLGEDNYGGDVKVADLLPLLSGQLFPNLRYLGLRDSEIADELAEALATAPILKRIEVLDLSLGNLSDKGAEALLAAPVLANLQSLDIHHHYVSERIVGQLQARVLKLNAEDPKEEEDDARYIAVGE